MGKEGPKDRLEMVSREQNLLGIKKVPRIDRLEMVSREPTWAKKVKDRLEMVSREPTWAKKVPRID